MPARRANRTLVEQRQIADAFVSDPAQSLATVGKRFDVSCGEVSYFVGKFYPGTVTNRTRPHDTGISTSAPNSLIGVYTYKWEKRERKPCPPPNVIPGISLGRLMAGR